MSIPSDLECKDCTIRLVRQALEWSKRYLFWSCADVDIVQAGDYSEDCNGHGKAFAGRCNCNRLYYGHRCQYQDECIKDDDCGRRGRCIDIDATTAPRKQCFCQLGYFGPGCAQGKMLLLIFAQTLLEMVQNWSQKYWASIARQFSVILSF